MHENIPAAGNISEEKSPAEKFEAAQKFFDEGNTFEHTERVYYYKRADDDKDIFYRSSDETFYNYYKKDAEKDVPNTDKGDLPIILTIQVLNKRVGEYEDSSKQTTLKNIPEDILSAIANGQERIETTDVLYEEDCDENTNAILHQCGEDILPLSAFRNIAGSNRDGSGIEILQDIATSKYHIRYHMEENGKKNGETKILPVPYNSYNEAEQAKETLKKVPDLFEK
ncbi:MAG: hypothetical protein HGB03_00730 [Candidatus Yonathbacteria bacterium]|nr:hypothetical protein [Candidatus Yonathbacteria bacterium]NTW47787.1 hypothetical protein [Candidatus Yonathbacteria bacterium]